MLSRTIDRYYLPGLGYVLLGYALFNRGFAYLGVPPLFVGEIFLVSGALLWLSCPYVTPLCAMVSPWLLVLTMLSVLTQTLPYLGRYKFDAIRDAMVVGYGAFAFLIFGMLVARPARLGALVARYEKFCYVYLIAMPLVRGLVTLAGGEEGLPRHPGTAISIICVRQGPMMVHLAGITAMLVARRASWGWFGLITLNFALAISNRGGLLAFLASWALLVLLRPGNRAVWRFAAYVTAGLTFLALTGFEVEIDSAGLTKQHRKLSFDGLMDQVGSIAGTGKQSNFGETKEWRLQWWRKIISYTFQGRYYLTGKGFGVNLADEDGFQTEHESDDKAPNRSPHNTHLTILARGGVPAFSLWVALQLSWAIGVFLDYARAARRRDGPWSSLFLVLLALWTANVIETSFDVYLESPMGGIWFYTMFGVGWAAHLIYRFNPEVLRPPAEAQAEPAPRAARPAGPAPRLLPSRA
jgi:hypothetical protein